MPRWTFGLVCALAALQTSFSECPNACSAHGRCTAFDMCACARNWQANDCSERVCAYGLAHVDSPKGDLDMSGEVTGPEDRVILNSFNYPFGTTEQYPAMEDSDLNVLTQSGHDYAECSNKGICDRKSGLCDCFDGYDGVACQRASCPGWPAVCSGHGVCRSAAQLAAENYGNSYLTWDRHTTMGCRCDKGYYGPDCSKKQCKFGVDPLYLDDSSTIKFSTFDVATLTTAPGSAVSLEDPRRYYTDDGVLFNDGTSDGAPGLWSIRFFDGHGEDWVTDPIKAGASCDDVVRALESLPNRAIPAGSVQCTRSWNAAMTADNEWGSTGQYGAAADVVAYTAVVPVELTCSSPLTSTTDCSGASCECTMDSTQTIADGTTITSIDGTVTFTAGTGGYASTTLTISAVSSGTVNTGRTFAASNLATLTVSSTKSGSLAKGMYLRGDGIPARTMVTDISGISNTLSACSTSMSNSCVSGTCGTCTLATEQTIAEGTTLQSLDRSVSFTAMSDVDGTSPSTTLTITAVAYGVVKSGIVIAYQGTVTLNQPVTLSTPTIVVGFAPANTDATVNFPVSVVGSVGKGDTTFIVNSIATGTIVPGMALVANGLPDGVTITSSTYNQGSGISATTLTVTLKSTNIARVLVPSAGVSGLVGQGLSVLGVGIGSTSVALTCSSPLTGAGTCTMDSTQTIAAGTTITSGAVTFTAGTGGSASTTLTISAVASGTVDTGLTFVTSSTTLIITSVSSGSFRTGMTVTGTGITGTVTLLSCIPSVIGYLSSGSCVMSAAQTIAASTAITAAPATSDVFITKVDYSSDAVSHVLWLSNLVTVQAGGKVRLDSVAADAIFILSAKALDDLAHAPIEIFEPNQPRAIYQTGHPSTSRHPYKISYRLAIWDAYASNEHEDIGEGGLYTPLVWFPGSFPRGYSVPPFSALVHASVTAPSTTVTVEQPGAVRLTTSAAYSISTATRGIVGWFTTASVKGLQNSFLVTGDDAIAPESYISSMRKLDGSSMSFTAKSGTDGLSSSTTLNITAVSPGSTVSSGLSFTRTVALTCSSPLTGAGTCTMDSTQTIAAGTTITSSDGAVTFTAGTGGSASTTLTISAVASGTVDTGLTFARSVTLTCSIDIDEDTDCTANSGTCGACTMNSPQTIAPGTAISASGFGYIVSLSNPLVDSLPSGSALLAYPSLVVPLAHSQIYGGATTIQLSPDYCNLTSIGYAPVDDGIFRFSGWTVNGQSLVALTISSYYPVTNGMRVYGFGITDGVNSYVTLSACSVPWSSTTLRYAGTCTMSAAQSLSPLSLLTAVPSSPVYTPFTSISRGSVITAANDASDVCSVTLSKPVAAGLGASSPLRLLRYGSFSAGDSFRTPLSTDGGPTGTGTLNTALGTITAVSGPALGVYTLTVSGARTFLAGEVIRSQVGGAALLEPTRASLSGYIYRLGFYGNPGKLRQPEIITRLDGQRKSLVSTYFDPSGLEVRHKVITKVWTDGQQGENVDYVSDHCDSVQVTIGNTMVSDDGTAAGAQQGTQGDSSRNRNAAAKFFLASLTYTEKQELKRCLGGSDLDEGNNQGVYNWDTGFDTESQRTRFPHLIKLVRSVTSYTDGGYYAALYFRENENLDGIEGGTFFLLNPFMPPDAMPTDRYEVYTTRGVLAQVSDSAAAVFSFGSQTIYTVNADPTQTSTNSRAENDDASSTPFQGDLSCASGTSGTIDPLTGLNNANANKARHISSLVVRPSTSSAASTTRSLCLAKNDMVTFLNPGYASSAMNPPFFNLYTIQAVSSVKPQWSNYVRYGSADTTTASLLSGEESRYDPGAAMGWGLHRLRVDLATNWGTSTGATADASSAGLSGALENSHNATFSFSGLAVFKFIPHKESSYAYVGECSNRGSCNVEEGECSCYTGYTGDACSEQSTLAF